MLQLVRSVLRVVLLFVASYLDMKGFHSIARTIARDQCCVADFGVRLPRYVAAAAM
jgi:hypothetical protein